MRKWIDCLNTVFAVLSALCLLLMKVAPGKGEALSGFFQTGLVGSVAFCAAIAVVALNLYLAVQEFRRCEACRQIEVVTESGVNRISVHALEAQLLDELSGEPDVSEARVAMDVRGENQPVRCMLSFKLARQSNVTGRSDALKKKVREAFDRILSGKATIEVSASVTDLVAPKAGSAEERATSDFFGPVYPTTREEEREERNS